VNDEPWVYCIMSHNVSGRDGHSLLEFALEMEDVSFLVKSIEGPIVGSGLCSNQYIFFR